MATYTKGMTVTAIKINATSLAGGTLYTVPSGKFAEVGVNRVGMTGTAELRFTNSSQSVVYFGVNSLLATDAKKSDLSILGPSDLVVITGTASILVLTIMEYGPA